MQPTIILSSFLLLGSLAAHSIGAPSPNLGNFSKNDQTILILRQDDGDDEDDATSGPNFGPQVAQIISGALSGNLGSILTGSFNLVEDEGVKNGLNAGWDTVVGGTTIPTTKGTSTVATTTTKTSVAKSSNSPTSTPTKTTAAVVAPVTEVTAEPVDLEPETTDDPEETFPSSTAANVDDDDELEAGDELLQQFEDIPSRSKVLIV